MLSKVMGIIGRWFMYLLTGLIIFWLSYVVLMGAINTVCDCQRELEKKRRGLIAPFIFI